LEAEINTFPTELIERRWLSEKTFEIKFGKPAEYRIRAGQRVRIYYQGLDRDYTPVSAPQDPEITLCIRKVDSGKLTPALSTAHIGTRFQISQPDGYFTFKPSGRPPVFVATGTGIAPFRAMVRAGVTGFTLLHGVDSARDLYYRQELESAAGRYIPCISKEHPSTDEYFHGRVTDYLQAQLPAAEYDFYLCGRREMIREVTWLVDERFGGSLIYSEQFY
jgi:NAD(P)H-flavin reductase